MHVELQNYYCVAKTVAEKTAMEEASKRGIHLVVVVPAFTLGETLQPALHLAMYMLIVSCMKGTRKACPNAVSGFVDVQDHYSRRALPSAIALGKEGFALGKAFAECCTR